MWCCCCSVSVSFPHCNLLHHIFCLIDCALLANCLPPTLLACCLLPIAYFLLPIVTYLPCLALPTCCPHTPKYHPPSSKAKQAHHTTHAQPASTPDSESFLLLGADHKLMDHPSLTHFQRDRSRSPRRRSPDHRDRARSPRSPRQSRRRSYSPRSRSRSRDEYHRRRSSRSPMSGSGGVQGGYSASGYQGSSGIAGGPRRSFEERAAAKDAMMQSLRDSSQQDRRVYVGNLSYDVKWHHLKDFMRQGACLIRYYDSLPSDFHLFSSFPHLPHVRMISTTVYHKTRPRCLGYKFGICHNYLPLSCFDYRVDRY